MDSYVHGEISELFGGKGSDDNTFFVSGKHDVNVKKKGKNEIVPVMSNEEEVDGGVAYEDPANKNLEGVDNLDVSSLSLPSKDEIERKERTIFIGNVPFVDKNVTVNLFPCSIHNIITKT